jgi:hypothetical protein
VKTIKDSFDNKFLFVGNIGDALEHVKKILAAGSDDTELITLPTNAAKSVKYLMVENKSKKIYRSYKGTSLPRYVFVYISAALRISLGG